MNDLSDMQRVTTVYEIVSAMKDVHMHNLIHRDLKPDNVLYDSSMHVKLIDFGIASPDDSSSKTVGVGSLKFMAPEILNESSDYNEKVGIYSFGVLLFFVLSNEKYPQISIAKVASGKKAPIPDCIDEFSRNLIMRCWSTNPEERPSFAEILEQIERANFRIIDGIEKDIFNIKKFLSI